MADQQTQPQEIGKPLVGIEFFNRQATTPSLWVAMACVDIELLPGIEYRIESEETEYRIEFEANQVTLYLQYRFGPKVLKRAYSNNFRNAAPWELVIDSFDIDYRLPNKP